MRYFFEYNVETHGGARTQNGSGRNKTKGTIEREGGNSPTAEMRHKIEGDYDK